MLVGVATVWLASPAWAMPQPAPAAPSDSNLAVVRIDPDPTPPGGLTPLHAFVSNQGPETTASTMVITVTLPREAHAEPPYFPENCEASRNHRLVRCEFGAGLRANRSATAIVPIRVSTEAAVGSTLKGSFTVQSPDDRDGRDNRTEFEIKVVEAAPDH
ncbi:hypothetical protein PL81_15300 [Streptomyces sp. RSD-27]|nr:hypothetical protein PL81_15300 [Streptomyces sp. RSD-27]